jgi:hypothetical protein
MLQAGATGIEEEEEEEEAAAAYSRIPAFRRKMSPCLGLKFVG